MDIYFYEAFREETEALKRALRPGIEAGFTALTIQEAGHASPPCPFISIRTQSVVPVSWAKGLSAILTRSTGFDHVRRFHEESGADIPAGYLPLYCSRSVAEQAMLLWMGLLRKLPRQTRQLARFERDGLTGSECFGKTLLVAGVGNIGIEVCRIGKGLGMNVLGVDIVRKHPEVEYVGIDEGLPRADVIVCAMNLTSANQGYFCPGIFKLAKHSAVFVNVARGELSPLEGLLKVLDEGLISGVGLDVYENESELGVSLRSGTAGGNPQTQACLELLQRDNVILTPHNAFNTFEAVERKSSQSAEQVASFLAGKRFIWDVP